MASHAYSSKSYLCWAQLKMCLCSRGMTACIRRYTLEHLKTCIIMQQFLHLHGLNIFSCTKRWYNLGLLHLVNVAGISKRREQKIEEKAAKSARYFLIFIQRRGFLKIFLVSPSFLVRVCYNWSSCEHYKLHDIHGGGHLEQINNSASYT